MLDVAFLILKIIGVILLILLGIILSALIVVLMLPARYQVEASADGDLKHAVVTAKIVWLLHLISANATYKDGVYQWKARIFWKKLHEKEEEQSEELEEEHTEELEESEETEKSEAVRKKKSRNRIREWLNKIKCTIQKICAKIKEIWKIKEKLQEFLSDEVHRATFNVVKKEFFYLIKHLRPRRMKGYVRYGLEDPYHTGLVLAMLSWIYPFWGKELTVTPEFEQQILEGRIIIKGYIRGIHIAKTAIRLLLDKNTKQTYEYLTQLKP